MKAWSAAAPPDPALGAKDAKYSASVRGLECRLPWSGDRMDNVVSMIWVLIFGAGMA
jgi:hypothetical protein